jgi:hypothetical protein
VATGPGGELDAQLRAELDCTPAAAITQYLSRRLGVDYVAWPRRCELL